MCLIVCVILCVCHCVCLYKLFLNCQYVFYSSVILQVCSCVLVCMSFCHVHFSKKILHSFVLYMSSLHRGHANLLCNVPIKSCAKSINLLFVLYVIRLFAFQCMLKAYLLTLTHLLNYPQNNSLNYTKTHNVKNTYTHLYRIDVDKHISTCQYLHWHTYLIIHRMIHSITHKHTQCEIYIYTIIQNHT